MATFTPISFTANTKAKSADVNGNFAQIQTILNGGIVDANIASGAAILRNKLSAGSLGQVAINDPTTGALSDYGAANTVQANWLPLSSQGSDPSTPPSGAVLLYNKNKKLYTINDAGAITQVGAGSNSSINYILNPDAEVDTTGWATYSSNVTATITIASPAVITVPSTTGYLVGDPVVFTTTGALPTGLSSGTPYYISAVASSTTFRVSATLGGADVNTSGSQSGTHSVGLARPLTGSGGTATATFTRSTSSPLRGTASFLYTAGKPGDGVAYAFTIDPADQAKVLNISFNYNLSSSITTGDYSVWIYDSSGNARRIQPAPSSISNLSTSLNGKFTATFQTASNSTTYRLCIHQSAASSSNLTIDYVQVGPQIIEYGAPVTDWTPITPVCSWTSATQSGKMRRSGDSMELEVELTGGSLNATGTLSLSPPSGYLFDTSKFVAGNSVVGVGYASHSSSVYTAVAILIDSTHIQFFGYNTNGWAAGTPFAWNAIDNLSFSVRVPIQGWGSSVVMSNDTDTRVTALSAHFLSSTTITSSTPLKFTTVIKDTHGVYSSSTGAYVAPTPGMYTIGFSGIYSTGGCDVHLYVNGVDIGLFGYIGNSDRKGSAVSYYLNAGDSVTIVPAQSISTADTEGFLSIYKLSGPAQIAASEPVNARAYQTGGQTAFGALTVIALDTKSYDTHGGLTLGAGSRYTAQTPGKYRLSWTVTSGNVAWTVGQSLIVMPYKNGAQAPGNPQDTCIAMASGTYRQTSRSSVTLDLLTGDYIDLRATADVTQSPLTSGTWMEVERIG